MCLCCNAAGPAAAGFPLPAPAALAYLDTNPGNHRNHDVRAAAVHAFVDESRAAGPIEFDRSVPIPGDEARKPAAERTRNGYRFRPKPGTSILEATRRFGLSEPVSKLGR